MCYKVIEEEDEEDENDEEENMMMMMMMVMVMMVMMVMMMMNGCVRLSGICLPSFPKQLTVGVLNSVLRCVRLVSGAVSASLGSVSPIICLPSFVSHVLCQGLCPPPWALCLPSVPKQFTVGVLNSLSSGVRLCSDGSIWLSGS